MIIIIYILIALILVFVCYTGIKAAKDGIEAKKSNKKHIEKKRDKNINITKEFSKLNKLYKAKAISKKEFQEAKKKILKN